jgi:ATP-dependent Clp protease ATP-binding subunit ClpA
MISIVRKELDAVRARLAEKKVTLDVPEDAVAFLAEKGHSSEFGARNVSRIIEDMVTTPLVDMVLFGELSGGGNALCVLDDANGGTLTISAAKG